jgi:voltage-gated potassium channel Kch
LGGDEETRVNEWFVPKVGGRRFRLLVGLSFYPYSLMNASYVLIGSLIAPSVNFGRMVGMFVVYLLAVGVAAHALDAMGPNKPWGDFLSRRQLGWLAGLALIPALALGLYFAIWSAPLLIPLGLAELFFLLAYNLELFGGRFHTDFWFAASWGFLPVLAGFVVQTNTLSLASIAGGFFGLFTAFVEISASRPYKSLKRQPGGATAPVTYRLESILKGIVATVLATAFLLLLHALYG